METCEQIKRHTALNSVKAQKAVILHCYQRKKANFTTFDLSHIHVDPK